MIFKLKFFLLLLFIFIFSFSITITDKQKEEDNNDENIEDEDVNKNSIPDKFVLLSSEGEMKEKKSSEGLKVFLNAKETILNKNLIF